MSEVSYKPEVLEWMEDYKAGLVKPQTPLTVENVETIIYIEWDNEVGGSVPLYSVRSLLDESFGVWHMIHTILRVGEWIEFKEGYKTFGIWDYYLHVRKYAPDSIHDERDTNLTIMVDGVFIDFGIGCLHLFTYKNDTRADYCSTDLDPDYGIEPSVESINGWLRENWPKKRIPKLLKP